MKTVTLRLKLLGGFVAVALASALAGAFGAGSGRHYEAIVAALVAALVFGGWLSRAVTRPLTRLRDVALAVAKGDVGQQIEHRSSDEVGERATAMRELIEYIQAASRAAQALGAGDLSGSLPARSEKDVLSHSLAHATRVLRELLAEARTLILAARSGELGTRAETSKYRGGYAELVGGMNGVLAAVADPLAEANRVLAALAARDLTARARGDFQGEYGRMMSSLNEASEKLEQSLLAVSSASDRVASASSEIASSSQAVAQGATEQASALEQTSSALIQMSASTKLNAENARQAKELANEAREVTSEGGNAMEQMTAAMNEIRTAAAGTAAIIRDINEIAFQTNLLALNAAVEAGRAGEAGRGFAVVAEEVRNLAQRSKEAARKTETLIRQSMALAEHGEAIALRVNEKLTHAVDSVGTVSRIVSEIATASQEQATGIEQSNHAMAQMDRVTQQAAANSVETSSAAEELAEQAQQLAALVSDFRLHTLVARASAKKGGPRRSHGVTPVSREHSFTKPSRTNGNGRRAEHLIPFDDEAELRGF